VFQEKKTSKPTRATYQLASDFMTGRKLRRKYQIKCPTCRRKNYMEHGDRLLCGCDTVLEVYGDSYYSWAKSDEGFYAQEAYPRATAKDMETRLIDRIAADPKVAAAVKKYPSVVAALEELEVLIKLHENI
jgi:ribosomal protein S27AE